MAALQRILELNHRRRRRSRVYDTNAHLRRHFFLLDIYSDAAIIGKYRLLGATIRQLIDNLGPQLQRPTGRTFALSPTVQVLTALRFYATGSFMEVVGDSLGLSKASVSRAVAAVTPLLLQHVQSISFPTTADEILQANQAFHAVAELPRVIGAIDGTLIQIASPSQDEPMFICRKGYPANVAGYHHVTTSPRHHHVTNVVLAEDGGFADSWLLGDSGYPLHPYLLTPVLQPATPAEHRHNEAHASTRNIVERAIGIWKQRFRCISHSSGGLQLAPDKCCSVIVATALLHNLAVLANAPLPEEGLLLEDVAGPPEVPPEPGRPHAAGTETRRRLINNLFAD
ncbi:putative nuclease HARBI1 [Sardina pilchardus]|uniref:putative nuclease HARBI1 n=1 Tax=Sardina pilchardus TaxID=27697 RepID=UPI002E152359